MRAKPPARAVSKSAPKPRRRRFTRVADSATGLIARAAGGHGFAEPDVLLNWREIVGEAHAGLCQPVRVSYAARGMGATLFVRASGARAPEVSHLAPRLIERVNQFYGYRAIARIRIDQSTMGGFSEPADAFAHAPANRDPGPEHRARAEEMTAAITDPAFRETLTRIGACVLAREARSGASTEAARKSTEEDTPQ